MKIFSTVNFLACFICATTLSFGTPWEIKEFDNVEDLGKDLCQFVKIPAIPVEKMNEVDFENDYLDVPDPHVITEGEIVRLLPSPPPSPVQQPDDQTALSQGTSFEIVPYEGYSKPTTSIGILKDLFHLITPETRNNISILPELSPWKLKDTIVLFDCDNVLHMNVDAILQDKYIWSFLKQVPKEQWKTAIWGGRKALVEKGMLDLVQYLQANDVPVFVFTRCSSDEKTMSKRFTILKALGFDFRSELFDNIPQELPLPEGYILEAKPGQSAITAPKYYNGIFFMGSADKGAGIKSSINFIYASAPYRFAPINQLKIVLIDDEEKNLLDAKKACSEYGIAGFKGYHYTAAKKQALQTIPNSLVVQTQYEAMSEGVWLDDKQAARVVAMAGDPFSTAFGLCNYGNCFEDTFKTNSHSA